MPGRASLHTVGIAASSVAMSGPGQRIRVENVDGAGYVSFRIDGILPTLGAEETYTVAKAAGANRELKVAHHKWPVTVSMIASVATIVSLMVVDMDDE